MKTQDLMIGDWIGVRVQVDDTGTEPVYREIPRKVTHLMHGNEGIYCDGVNQFGGVEFEPIPLTQEILEKNGFEKKEDDYGQELYSLLLGEWAITYMSISGCPYLTIEDVLDYDRAHSVLNLKDCVYNVHELQHALRLCGIEKEITL